MLNRSACCSLDPYNNKNASFSSCSFAFMQYMHNSTDKSLSTKTEEYNFNEVFSFYSLSRYKSCFF